MATDGLVPAFFRLYYSTPYAQHVMTRTIREVSGAALGNFGTVTTWTDDITPTDDMINDFVAQWLLYQTDTTTADFWDAFIKPTADDLPIFLGSQEVGDAGALTSVGAGDNRGLQHQMVFKSTIGGTMFVSSLDRPAAGFVGSKTTLGAAEGVFRDYVIGGAHALCAADNGQPLAFRRLNVKYNDKLLHQYGVGS